MQIACAVENQLIAAQLEKGPMGMWLSISERTTRKTFWLSCRRPATVVYSLHMQFARDPMLITLSEWSLTYEKRWEHRKPLFPAEWTMIADVAAKAVDLHGVLRQITECNE